ncbi:MAG: UDP-3-O-(3-hydroxymyristoyl)glucosamine N-acyltransferase [candidate division Zixibacteria bacterium]|nr:UDP-3-O-(3-hydroxymyristoyl)glucosamine N-acyltransferase [Candidatus Tariuqbacter arcticus]
MRLSQIADAVSGGLEGEDLEISGINTLTDAEPGQISFLSNPIYKKFLAGTKASAVIVDRKQTSIDRPVIRTDNPYHATLKVVKLFYPEPEPIIEGVHPSAVIASSADIGRNVGIAAGAVIGENVVIGDSTAIGANAVIESGSVIGSNTRIHAGVIVRHSVKIGDRVIIHPGAVIGAEGFGFAPIEGHFQKIPQVGTVIIEDDADIGANTCIDRAFLGATRIGKGVKLDNLIQIAHNVEIGDNTVIAAQTGIAGSTRIGKGVMMGGQVGITGHIEISDGIQIGAQSGVSKNFPPGTTIFGYPARPIMETKRIEASLKRLPELLRQVADLKKSVNALIKD